MSQAPLNKSTLHRQQHALKRYKRFLPSLDMKRRQLLLEQHKAREMKALLQIQLEQIEAEVSAQLPMLGDDAIDPGDLVHISGMELSHRNIMGIHLPILQQLEINIRPYSTLASPAWIDPLTLQLKRAIQTKIELHLAQTSLELLDQEVRKITQRVNLFDKVLIPQSQEHIRRIQIYLSDLERASVVRAKIAKRKRASS